MPLRRTPPCDGCGMGGRRAPDGVPARIAGQPRRETPAAALRFPADIDRTRHCRAVAGATPGSRKPQMIDRLRVYGTLAPGRPTHVTWPTFRAPGAGHGDGHPAGRRWWRSGRLPRPGPRSARRNGARTDLPFPGAARTLGTAGCVRRRLLCTRANRRAAHARPASGCLCLPPQRRELAARVRAARARSAVCRGGLAWRARRYSARATTPVQAADHRVWLSVRR